MASYKKNAAGKYVRTDQAPRQGPRSSHAAGRPLGPRQTSQERMAEDAEKRNFSERINAIAARGTREEAEKLDALYGDTTPGPAPRRRFTSAATTVESGREV